MKIIKAFKQISLLNPITRNILIMSIVFIITKSMSTASIYADFQCDIDQANGYVERIPVIEEECKPLKWDDLSDHTRYTLKIISLVILIVLISFVIGYITDSEETARVAAEQAKLNIQLEGLKQAMEQSAPFLPSTNTPTWIHEIP